MNNIYLRVILLLVATTFLSSCAGSRANLKLADLTYPCSMSPFLYGHDEEILAKDKNLQVVGQLNFKTKIWGMVWSFVSVSEVAKDKEIALKINEEVSKLNADGVVNFEITTEDGGMNYVYPMTVTPLWPGFTHITVKGDIVTRIKK
jgi:hypothetical protein